MKNYKKTLWGSIIAFFVGTSCCWLSSLAVWVGGVAFVGMIVGLVEDIQVLLISLGAILFAVTVFLYLKRRKGNQYKAMHKR